MFFGIIGNFAVSITIIELEPWKARGWVIISLNLFPTMNSVDELCFDLTCMHVVCGEGWDIWEVAGDCREGECEGLAEARPDILDKEIAMRKMELVANSLVLFCYHDLYIASIDWDCFFNIHAFDICSGHILRDANGNFVLVQKLGNWGKNVQTLYQ